MKRIVYILLLILPLHGVSQTFIQRTSGSITPVDQRLKAGLNFYLPVSNDTTLNGGLDSLGAMLYRMIDSAVYIRIPRSGGKMWKKLLRFGDVTATTWGSITGTLSNQTDLQNALNGKLSLSDTAAMLSSYLRKGLSDGNIFVGNVSNLAEEVDPSTLFIMNQSAIPQSASFWINDSALVGNLTISKRGFGNAPSIFTTSFITFFNSSNLAIFEGVGNTSTNYPKIRLTGSGSGAPIIYSGIVEALNRAPGSGSQPLLITTSGDAISTNGIGGNIILRPGTNSVVNTAATQQFTNDSVIVQLRAAGTGNFYVSGRGVFTDTLTAITLGNSDSSNRVASTAWVKRQGYSTGGGGTITGSGTADFVTRWTGSTVIGNGIIQDNGTEIGINKAPVSGRKLDMTDPAYFQTIVMAGTSTLQFNDWTGGATKGYFFLQSDVFFFQSVALGTNVWNLNTNTGLMNTRILTNAGLFTQSDKSIFADTAALAARFSYNTNLGSTFTIHSLVDKNYVDSLFAGSGGGDTTALYLPLVAFAGAGSDPDTIGIAGLTTLGTATQMIRINAGATGFEYFSTLGPTAGGTGLTTYTTGDFPYASATNVLSKRAIGSTGDVLTVSGGVPTWVAQSTLSTTPYLTPVGADPDNWTAAVSTFTSLPDLAGAGGSKTVTLPSAASNAGKFIYLWNKNADGTNVWSFAAAITLADGTTSSTFTNQTMMVLFSEGSVWVKTN